MKTLEPVPVTDVAGGAILAVRVTPRAGRTAIAGVRDGRLRVKLAAAPVEGAANEALLKLLATALGIPRGHMTFASGDKSRDKRVRVAGLRAADVARRLSVVVPVDR